MADQGPLDVFLAAARVDPGVFALRPDYRAVLVTEEPVAHLSRVRPGVRAARRPIAAGATPDQGV